MFASAGLFSAFAGAIAVLLAVGIWHLAKTSDHANWRLRLIKDERARITQELHDGFLQDVIAAQMLLRQRQCQGVETTSDLELVQASHLLSRAVSSARESLREVNVRAPIRPGEVGGYLAASAIVRLCRSTKVEVSEEGRRWSMSDYCMERVFWVIREAVVNACKHSDSDRIDVKLHWKWMGLEVDIRDRGRGFLPSQAGDSGRGLEQMQRNALDAGGRVNLHSRPGAGTHVHLMVRRFPIRFGRN